MSQTTITGVAIIGEDNVVYSLPAPNRHYHVIHLIAELGHTLPIRGEQGFVTSEGAYVDRIAGAEVALASGQIANLSWPPKLFSEDLW